MKKLTALLLVLVMGFSFVACGGKPQTDNGGTDSQTETGTEQEIQQDEAPLYDEELYTLFENLVSTVQPGTAGSSMKAIYAAKDLLGWVKENNDADPRLVAATVKYFFENSGLAEEASQAFADIRNVFTTLVESDAAQDLLDMVGMAVEDFEVPDEIMQRLNDLLAEIENYCTENLTEKE